MTPFPLPARLRVVRREVSWPGAGFPEHDGGRSVVAGRAHSVSAEIADVDDRAISTRAVIVGDDGRRCATATATFVPLDLEQASAAAGSPIPENIAGYTTGGAQ